MKSKYPFNTKEFEFNIGILAEINKALPSFR